MITNRNAFDSFFSSVTFDSLTTRAASFRFFSSTNGERFKRCKFSGSGIPLFILHELFSCTTISQYLGNFLLNKTRNSVSINKQQHWRSIRSRYYEWMTKLFLPPLACIHINGIIISVSRKIRATLFLHTHRHTFYIKSYKCTSAASTDSLEREQCQQQYHKLIRVVDNECQTNTNTINNYVFVNAVWSQIDVNEYICEHWTALIRTQLWLCERVVNIKCPSDRQLHVAKLKRNQGNHNENSIQFCRLILFVFSVSNIHEHNFMNEFWLMIEKIIMHPDLK